MAITYKLELNSKPKEDSTCGIMLRITENRKHKRISTGVFVHQNDFNKKADIGKWIRRSNPKYATLNEELEKFIQDAKDAKLNLEKNKQVVTVKNIISQVKHKNTDSFIEFYETSLENVLLTRSYNFYKNSVSKLKNLKAFLNGNDLLFSEVDYEFLSKYEEHLYGKGNAKNTVFTNLKTIRIYFYRAVKEKKLAVYNPFKDFKLKEEAGNKKRLDLNQIKNLESLSIEENSSLWHTRNYFLFSFYCAGIRVGDLIQLKWKDIEGDFLIYKMNKNGETMPLKLIAKAQEILKYYKPVKPNLDSYIFPLFDNNILYTNPKFLNSQIGSKTAIINNNLKRLAKLAEINTNLTNHISRHSYADIVRKSGASLYDLKNLLGHSNTKITEKYIASFDKEASDNAHTKAMDY